MAAADGESKVTLLLLLLLVGVAVSECSPPVAPRPAGRRRSGVEGAFSGVDAAALVAATGAVCFSRLPDTSAASAAEAEVAVADTAFASEGQRRRRRRL